MPSRASRRDQASFWGAQLPAFHKLVPVMKSATLFWKAVVQRPQVSGDATAFNLEGVVQIYRRDVSSLLSRRERIPLSNIAA
jgi:hypothetical protein